MEGQSINITEQKLKELQQIIPDCFTEGKLDWEKLRVFFGEQIEFKNERYHLSWAGKIDSYRLLQTPTYKTLKPCREESINFDETENVFIEGDNLEVLKTLQKAYFGKIKMIYIDPPYNTGNDFIYKDDFSETLAGYRKKVGDVDEEGNVTKAGLFKNTKENGQYHSNWLNMMLPRLFLARNLLRDDGVIFISIDDNEVHNLRLLMDEIFGEENFVGNISIINNLKGRSDDKFFATCNEYLLVYGKNINELKIKGFQLKEEEIEDEYIYQDKFGKYKLTGFRKTGKGWRREDRPYMYYPILEKNVQFYSIEDTEYNQIYDKKSNKFVDDFVGNLKTKYEKLGYNVYLPLDSNGNKGRWRWGFQEYKKRINDIALNSNNTPSVKERPYLEDGSIRKKLYKTTWYKGEYDTGSAATYLNKVFNKDLTVFENPKSIVFINDILKISTSNNDLILDFFAGSGTTAHAVMELNKEDGGNRKWILVQLPEPTDPESEAYKAGYKTIADIAKERIRRAAKKIQEEIKEDQK
ncbi:MAG TPA: site-specific DNA-methyltransferase, partial [Victivallales bacterium]|nr:site-specific DNA-methyltransferase [Victivallales bacterium]